MELKMLDMKEVVTNPLQPRQEFNREKLQELANSIREGELLQPIVVRRNNGNKYEIVCGERRYKAFQILKELKIPAIIRNIKDDTDALEKSLIENLQRDDLTSVERENAVGALWDSKKYKTKRELSKKLGVDEATVGSILIARDDRKTLVPRVSTTTLTETQGLSGEPRKKLIKQVETGKIGMRDVRDVVRKVKEFPEPEQQIEILDEFEQQEEQSKEIFDDIIKKKKDIAEGKRPLEQVIEIETDSEKRMLESYENIKVSVYGIYSDHILHFKKDKIKRDAIKILWDIHNYTRKQLVNLGEIQEVDVDES